MNKPHPRWTVDMVPPVLSSLEPIASYNGFLVSAYGSTMRYGNGRDLDLIFVQKRIGAVPRYCLDAVIHDLPAKLLGTPEASMFAELSVLLELTDGRVLDMQFRLSKCGPSDALDLYEGRLR